MVSLVLMTLMKSFYKNFFQNNSPGPLRMVKVNQENMQRHTESISFVLFLNISITGTPHLSESEFT